MPTLNWIGKDKVINHHLDVPFHTLDRQYTVGDSDSGNKIINGDNLVALKALLPEYEGKIKCIYIDPPYNTGNEGWIYNDNVNAPQIKRWLGQVVGKEGEDLSRHDKWLCMMYPRLQLLHKLLADDGAIFISIDDNEQANLKLLCDEIFGEGNQLANLIWDLGTGTTAGHFTRGHEYILCYSKNKSILPNFKNPNKGEEICHGALKKISAKNPAVEIEFPKGFEYDGENAVFSGILGDSEKEYILSDEMKFEKGKLTKNVIIKAGFAMRNQLEDFIAGKDVYDTKGQRLKRFFFNKNGILFYEKEKTITNPKTVLKDIANTKKGSSDLINIFQKEVFDFPKPQEILFYLFQLITDKSSIILDSFAGSGTTAHAVLNLNKKDGGNRKFILVEMEDYAETITAERVKRVINGYGEGDKAVEGTGGGFDYFSLGKTIFNADGNLNEDVGVEKIREYIWYSETGTSLPSYLNEYFLGSYNATDYYFYYEQNEETILTRENIGTIIKQKAEGYIIYADACQIEKKFMETNNITFKRIPRDIKKL